LNYDINNINITIKIILTFIHNNMESSVFISIPEYLNSINFTTQNVNNIETKINKEVKCSCDVCLGHATVLYLDNYNYNYSPLKTCKKKSKSFKQIETQFNYTNYPSYSVANLEELSLKSINPLIIKEEELSVSTAPSSNLTSPSLTLTSSFSFDSFRSSPDLFQELLCLECGNAEYCECFSDKYSPYNSFKKIEEIETIEEKDKLKEIEKSKFYDYPYSNFYDEKKDCDCNLICYDSDCDCHYYEV